MIANSPLTPPAGRAAQWRPGWLVLLLIGAAAGAKLVRRAHLPWPDCWLSDLTGFPCPSCGTTRSLLAWLELDLAAAFGFNPLFFLGCLALLAWLAGVVLDHAFSWRVVDRVWQAANRWPAGRIVLVLVALNWLYLCFNLPK